MNRENIEKPIVLIIIVGLIIFTSLFVQPANCQQAGQVTGNFIDMKILVFLRGHYYLFEPYVNQEVEVTVTLNLTTPPPEDYEITIRTAFSLTKIVEIPPYSNYTFGFWGFPPTGALIVRLPGGLENGTIRLAGQIRGRSVLFRTSVEIPVLIEIESSVGYVSTFSFGIVPPRSSRILTIYSKFYPDLEYEEGSIDDEPCLIIPRQYPGVDFVTLYEHSLWQPSMVILMVSFIFLVIALPHITIFRENLSKALKKKMPNKLQTFNEKTSIVYSKLLPLLKKPFSSLAGIDPSRLFHLYILVCLLMISLSLFFGPDPRLKVYVLSSTRARSDAVEAFVENNFGGKAINVFDEMAEFGTLVNLNIFPAVIVSDFIPPRNDTLDKYIYPGLDIMSRRKNSIVVLESHVHPDLAASLQQRYGEKIVFAEDFNDLQEVLEVHMRFPRRTNVLGMSIPVSLYLVVAGSVGFGSLLLVFFGTAFLAGKLIEVGRKPKTVGLLEAIVFSAFTFLFTEIIYILCGVLLAMPLGLHAGGSRITAVGLFGFGGGSRPRMLFGFLGFLIGTVVSLKEGEKLSRMGFAVFLVSVLFVVADPLTGGVIFHEFILLYSVGPYSFETAFWTMSYIKDFLSSIGAALGGWASSTLRLSTGIMLYYAGAVPFCLFPKLQRGTATLLLLFSAFSVASGGIRVSNMLPWEALTSSIPGMAVGLFAALIFYAVSYGEFAIRKKVGAEDIV